MQLSASTACGAAALLFLAACGDDRPAAPRQPAAAPLSPTPASTPPVKLDLAEIKRLFASEPKAPPAPVAATPAMVQLGQRLYHDASLSKNRNLSCASCHDLARYGVDNKPTSPGTDGKNGARNTPSTWNAARQFVQFWDGRAASVEEQSTGPVLNPVEHGLADEAELLARLRQQPELVAAFQQAFPGADDAVTVANFQRAVGAFERTLVTRSRWDDFLDGRPEALTAAEQAGLDLFVRTGCIECHATRLLGGDSYQLLGKARRYPVADQGRFEVTQNDADKQVFKVPSLLNVDKTAPYFHDGAKATLEETIKIMADVQLQKSLSKAQVDSIAGFLRATTGELPELAR